MEIKKLNIKKGANVFGIVMSIILAVAVFGILFNWVLANGNESSITVPSEYNQSYQRLLDQQSNLNSTLTDIRDGIAGLTEPESSIQQAFGGFARGALALFQLPLDVLTQGLTVLSVGMELLSFIPGYVIVSITLGITAIIIFALLRFVTQRGNDA